MTLSKRLAWRAGRKLYCAARGESNSAAVLLNGEAGIQARALAAIPIEVPFRAIDIGANQGDWTKSLLDQALATRPRGGLHIDAFEPVPATADRFDANLASVPVNEAVHLHRFAVSHCSKIGHLAVTSATGGTNTLHPDGTTGEGTWCKVRLTSLDQFCSSNGVQHIHLVKSDTEGHDVHVLKGAQGLLAAGRIDVFQFEYNHRWVHARSFLKDVFDLVDSLPYRVGKVRRGGAIDVYDGWHPELERFFEANYVLVREPALGWFDVRSGMFDASNTYA